MKQFQATMVLDFEATPDWYVYVLCDPRETDPVKRVRYVGVTKRGLDVRLAGHLADKAKTHKCNWIMSLRALGLTPTIELVDSGFGERPWDCNEQA